MAATSPFEQKNRKTVGKSRYFFLFIWYSDVQYASIFILWWGQRFRVALVVTGTYCELLTCISVVESVVGGVKGTENALLLEIPPPFPNVYKCRRFWCACWGWGVKRIQYCYACP